MSTTSLPRLGFLRMTSATMVTVVISALQPLLLDRTLLMRGWSKGSVRELA